MTEEDPFSARDKSGARASEAARLRAVEITLWEIINGLIEQGVVDRSDVHNRIDAKWAEIARSGTIDTDEDAENFATSLALDRVRPRLHDKESK